MLAITFDVDWAPDAILDRVIAGLDDFGVPSTIFCTDFTTDASGNSSSLLGRFHERHEIALHPNFIGVASYEAVWDRLLALYPGVRGWRSHNGLTGFPIVTSAMARGLRYEVLAPVFRDHVTPWPVNRALKSYYAMTTSFWDSHMLHQPDFSWSADALPHQELFARQDKIVVLGFHPNIVYYDMRCAADYDSRKPTYHVVDEAHSFERQPPCGAMKLLREILETVPHQHFTGLSQFGSRMGYW